MSRTDSKPIPWEPIKDLPDNWRELASPELRGLAAVWREQKERLADSPALKKFNERLSRKWAIETGLIENLYSLDRGTTQLLIERGIKANLIEHGASNKPPEFVAAIVTDQQHVLEGIFDFVKGNRELTTSYIKEMHSAFTQHQPTLEAMDPFGHIQSVALLRGEWKQLPNNPSRPDGEVHEYAPPIQTASEMDRLIQMHAEHIALGVPPEVEAAWLHHRFTQIHPFHDGNGRIARTLASIIFIKSELFPLVITRDINRDEYIKSLETADSGDLSVLITLFANQQKLSILEAVDTQTASKLEAKNIDEILRVATNRLIGKVDPPLPQYASAYHLAYAIEHSGIRQMLDARNKIFDAVQAADTRYSATIAYSSDDERKWSGERAVVIGNRQGYIANTDNYRSIIRIAINQKEDSELGLVIHTLGSSFIGNMGVTPYFYHLSRFRTGNISESLIEISTFPFTFTYLDDQVELENRFRKWLDEVILFGLDEWRKQL